MPWTDRVGRRLTPRDLHIFMTVAEAGSMAQAADRLAISRPVISKTIAGLEAVLGVRLFDRTATGSLPTPYGEVLLRRGIAVFDELRHSVQEIAELADPNAGLLRIGTTEVTAGGIVAASIARLSARYPRMRFYTERGGVHLRMDLLRERRVDVFVIRPATKDPDPDVAFEPLMHDRLLVTCGATSAWARRRRVSLADLVHESWILAPAEVAPGGSMAVAFAAAGAALPETIMISDSLPMRLSLLATGRFITVIPHSTVMLAPRPHWLRILPIAIQPWHLPTVIATLRHRTLTPLAQLFIDEARAVVATLGDGGP
ncbi:LysR family transcriptional regulator [Sediminicoccus sp. KRV36]|uniref:LysR family transcriptional regulator n=1 Tax=Sediminicoccus sp. KRV36 TaxID=3133721 RepID=UPI00200D1E25|nr:LysR family transcriptional regulator [Sediminicoccus rosea]UPY38949.1 LysR family transcriptional regulator [Sediminicoccus rosea]